MRILTENFSSERGVYYLADGKPASCFYYGYKKGNDYYIIVETHRDWYQKIEYFKNKRVADKNEEIFFVLKRWFNIKKKES